MFRLFKIQNITNLTSNIIKKLHTQLQKSLHTITKFIS